MTRRQGILALLMAWAGMATKVQGQEALTLWPKGVPQSLTFMLGNYTQVIVVYRGETVTLDANEVFEALKEAK